jgi:hypothetical protein
MRRTGTDQATEYKSQARYYMATFSDGSGQFFPDFRQFIVRASRKLGLVEGLAAAAGNLTAQVCLFALSMIGNH